MRIPTNADCPGCDEPIVGAGFDPGHSYGCEIRPCKHERFCSLRCYDADLDRAATHAAETIGDR